MIATCLNFLTDYFLYYQNKISIYPFLSLFLLLFLNKNHSLRQHDAQEFLSSLLDTLHNEMASSLCALIKPSALGPNVTPTSSKTKQINEFHTPIKTDIDTKMDIDVEENKGALMIIKGDVMKHLEVRKEHEVEVEVEVDVEGENKDLSTASRFFIPKKSQREIINSRIDSLLSDHLTPPLTDLVTTPEGSNNDQNVIDRSSKRPRDEAFSTPQSRKSIDRYTASKQDATLPATSTAIATSTSTPVCAPHEITPDNLPSFLSSCIPTSKHFHAQVKSTFECLHCGFFREPKMVRPFLPSSFFQFLPFSLPSSIPSFLPSSLPLSFSPFLPFSLPPSI